MRPRGGCNGARKQVSRATLRGVRVGLCAAELIVEEEKQLEELKKLLASADSTGDVTGADALRSKIDAIKAKEAEVVKEEAELNADIRKLRDAEFHLPIGAEAACGAREARSSPNGGRRLRWANVMVLAREVSRSFLRGLA